jgi:hypothetical protein
MNPDTPSNSHPSADQRKDPNSESAPSPAELRLVGMRSDRLMVRVSQDQEWSFPSAHIARFQHDEPNRLVISCTTHSVAVTIDKPGDLLYDILSSPSFELVAPEAATEEVSATWAAGATATAISVDSNSEAYDL